MTTEGIPAEERERWENEAEDEYPFILINATDDSRKTDLNDLMKSCRIVWIRAKQSEYLRTAETIAGLKADNKMIRNALQKNEGIIFDPRFPTDREKIGEMLRSGIHFSGQTGDYVITTAIDDILGYIVDRETALQSELERTKAGGWISVKTRLPEVGTYTLALFNDGTVLMARLMSVWFFYWHEGFKPQHEDDHGRKLTHWQPLPANPEPLERAT